ncbi:hypothetical protein [Zhihengliuella sp.]|uniref:hypothetical protein n=1 Tax=Zhihengliuella sp. TaxID=1954483 RepID=UPI0028125632|nr:hypothetical protein [Zhihengliuella sp.]
MFDKLVRKGKQMAGDYVREQLQQRSGDGQRGPGGRQADRQPGYGSGGYDDRGYEDRGRGGHGDRRYENRGPDSGRQRPQGAPGGDAAAMSREDRAAIEKYRYMLRTAPPQEMERAHEEAFARLTPQQRALLQSELSEELPPAERPGTDRPHDLARAATRAEVSRPGFMEKLLGGGGAQGGGSRRPGMGGLAAGAAGGLGAGLMAGVAGAFIGTAIAGPLLDGFSGLGEELSGAGDGLTEGIAGAGEGIAGAGEGITAAGEGLTDQAGGLLGGLFGGEGGGFGGFGGDGGGFGDFEV